MRRFRQFFQNLKIRRKIQLFSAVLVLLLCVVFVCCLLYTSDAADE